MLAKTAAVALIAAATCQSVLAAPQVAPDNLWTDNLVWKCAILAAYAPENSAARADLPRIAAAAFASKVEPQTLPIAPGLTNDADRSEDFWRGANYGAALDFVVTDLFARLPANGGPKLLGKSAAQLYDERGCPKLGR